MTLDELNGLSQPDFVSEIGWVFEDSPWVAERAWNQRPFETIEQLREKMIAAVEAASREEKMAMLRAHPDLGSRIKMTDASSSEQSRAGLDRLTAEQHERLQWLNKEYREKFGFPFLLAVKGSTPREVLDALERRIGHTPDAEFQEALRQVSLIAWFRLEALR